LCVSHSLPYSSFFLQPQSLGSFKATLTHWLPAAWIVLVYLHFPLTVLIYSVQNAGSPDAYVAPSAATRLSSDSSIDGLQFSRQGPGRPRLVASKWGTTVRGWQMAESFGARGPASYRMTCEQEVRDRFDQSFSARTSAFSRDGTTFAVSSYRSHVCIWQMSASVWSLTAALDVPGDWGGIRRATRVLQFSHSTDLLAAGDDAEGMHLWRRTAQGRWEPHASRIHRGSEKVRGLAFSSDDRWLAATGYNGELALWSLDVPGSELILLQGHISKITAVGWRAGLSEEGCAVIASGGEDLTLRIWRLCSPAGAESDGMGLAAAAAAVVVIRDHSQAVMGLQWSSTGLLASSSEDTSVLIHSFQDGKATLLHVLRGHASGVWAMSWAPDGRKLATAADGSSLRFWDFDQQISASQPYSSWVISHECRDLTWLSQEPQRLACASMGVATDGGATDDSAYLLELILVDADYQMKLLSSLTYGELGPNDLQVLGYQDITSTALDPTIADDFRSNLTQDILSPFMLSRSC